MVGFSVSRKVWLMPRELFVSSYYGVTVRPGTLLFEARRALIALHLLKCRPKAVMGLRVENFDIKQKFVYVSLPALGKRPAHEARLLLNDDLVQDLLRALMFKPPTALLFPRLFSLAKRHGRSDGGRRLQRLAKKLVESVN